MPALRKARRDTQGIVQIAPGAWARQRSGRCPREGVLPDEHACECAGARTCQGGRRRNTSQKAGQSFHSARALGRTHVELVVLGRWGRRHPSAAFAPWPRGSDTADTATSCRHLLHRYTQAQSERSLHAFLSSGCSLWKSRRLQRRTRMHRRRQRKSRKIR